MQNDCAELKIRAERKAGEFLRDNIIKGGDTRPEAKLHDVTLKNCGVEKIQSHRIFNCFLSNAKVERRRSLPSASNRLLAGFCVPHRTIHSPTKYF